MVQNNGDVDDEDNGAKAVPKRYLTTPWKTSSTGWKHLTEINKVECSNPKRFCLSWLVKCMVKTNESRLPPSPNLDKVTVSYDKLNNTDLFLQMHGVYIVHKLI